VPFPLPEGLPLTIQTAWLIPLYGFSGMLLSLPWATGWIKREGPRPAAYLNLLLSVVALVHGSLVISKLFTANEILIAGVAGHLKSAKITEAIAHLIEMLSAGIQYGSF
jgi:hypothetical protein